MHCKTYTLFLCVWILYCTVLRCVWWGWPIPLKKQFLKTAWHVSKIINFYWIYNGISKNNKQLKDFFCSYFFEIFNLIFISPEIFLYDFIIKIYLLAGCLLPKKVDNRYLKTCCQFLFFICWWKIWSRTSKHRKLYSLLTKVSISLLRLPSSSFNKVIFQSSLCAVNKIYVTAN